MTGKNVPKSVIVEANHRRAAPAMCRIPRIFCAAKNWSAMRPMMSGAAMAPSDWVR
jgi:hypothetical protein